VEVFFEVFEAHAALRQFGVAETVLQVIERYFLTEYREEVADVFRTEVPLSK